MGVRTVLVTSPGPGDGKTATTLNLAIAATRDGNDVVAVDADTRHRGLTTLTGREGAPGLTELAENFYSPRRCTQRCKIPGATSTRIVPAGSQVTDVGRFFGTGLFPRALVAIRDQAELVLVDSPPMLSVADTLTMAPHVDGILLVVSPDTADRALHDTIEQLALVDTPLLGYVFNRGDDRPKKYGYAPYRADAEGTVADRTTVTPLGSSKPVAHAAPSFLQRLRRRLAG